MSLTKSWRDLILQNFEKASQEYNQNANIQKIFALRLAKECAKHSIPKGLWADLGAGTGLLSEALEKYHPNQKVIRVDGSQGMLAQQKEKSNSILWDLNFGLPKWDESPQLLASNFALQWLSQPTKRLKEWIQALDKSGWVAIAVPVQGSFPEWEIAASKANVSFTAAPFPSHSSLIKSIGSAKLHYEKVHEFIQEEKEALSLLKPLTKIGAKTSPKRNLSHGELRRLLKAWPNSQKEGKVTLTWSVQMLLIQI